LAGAVEQVGAEPLFQAADATAEGGLGGVPGLGSAREVAARCQRQEVFQPDQVHQRFVQRIEVEKMSIGAADSVLRSSGSSPDNPQDPA
jgi:hypothetical protein